MENKEIVVLKCVLKKDTPDGTYIILQPRFQGVEFEVRDPAEGQELNIRRRCDVKVIKMIVPTEIEVSEIEKKPVDNSELLDFATDCWNLAVELREEIESLQAVETPVEKITKSRKKKG